VTDGEGRYEEDGLKYVVYLFLKEKCFLEEKLEDATTMKCISLNEKFLCVFAARTLVLCQNE